MIPDAERARLEGQIRQLREEQAFGRSPVLNRLFDYLVETSLQGRSPKEIEVAAEVFRRGDSFDAMQDASVRVYVHRLRRKLEDFYAGPGAGEPERLVMPRGEYRLSLAPTAGVAMTAEDEPPPLRDERPALSSRRKLLAVAVASAVALSLAALVWLALRPDAADRELAEVRAAPFWNPTLTGGKTVSVVLGDYYIFGEVGSGGNVARLVRQFDINSRTDLDEHVMHHPELMGDYVDLGLHYYPIGVAQALRDLTPIVRTPDRRGVHQPRIIQASNLNADTLRQQNIVYIGYLSGLGPLLDPVFNGSRFQIGHSFDELVDRKTGTIYAATEPAADASRQDYAYISRFPGPAGTSVVIIAGTRDAAVMQAADFVSQAANLRDVQARAGGRAAFEALLRVDAVGDQNLTGKLILAAPLNVAAIWRNDQRHSYPDRLPAAER